MLHITERIDSGRTILTLSGRLDLSTRKTFQTAIHQAQASGTPHLILNLAQVSHIDTAGFGWLMVTHHELQNAQHHLILVVPPGSLWSLMKLVELDKLMPIVATEEEAHVPSASVHPITNLN